MKRCILCFKNFLNGKPILNMFTATLKVVKKPGKDYCGKQKNANEMYQKLTLTLGFGIFSQTFVYFRQKNSKLPPTFRNVKIYRFIYYLLHTGHNGQRVGRVCVYRARGEPLRLNHSSMIHQENDLFHDSLGGELANQIAQIAVT